MGVISAGKFLPRGPRQQRQRAASSQSAVNWVKRTPTKVSDFSLGMLRGTELNIYGGGDARLGGFGEDTKRKGGNIFVCR